MTTKSEITTRTLRLIKRYARENIDIDPDTPFADLDLDSLALFEVVYELEEAFAVELDEKTLGKIATVRDLTGAIHRELESSGRDATSARTGG